MSGEIRKEFKQYDDYYVFRNGEIKEFRKDKDFVLDLMKDEKLKIEKYLKDQKMNFKNIASLKALFEFYNSIKGG